MVKATDLMVQTFWATYFYARLWPEHPQEASGIRDFLYGLKTQQTNNIASGVAPGAKSAYGLYESNFDLLAYDHTGLQKLKVFLQESVQMAVAHVNGVDNPINGDNHSIHPQQIQVEITDCWFHITNNGGFHDAHYHSGCSWCGIYYLQIGDSGKQHGTAAPNGSNRFYSPLWKGNSYMDFGNQYLNTPYVHPPLKDGMVLLFPSYLMHSGLPYQGQQDRIVISFNSRSALVQPDTQN